MYLMGILLKHVGWIEYDDNKTIFQDQYGMCWLRDSGEVYGAGDTFCYVDTHKEVEATKLFTLPVADDYRTSHINCKQYRLAHTEVFFAKARASSKALKWTIFLCIVSFVAGVLLSPIAAHAGQITISHPESEELQNGKTLCTYTTPVYTFTITVKGRCPVSKTFDTDDSE